ncbi:hypothetical protein [Helicobacter pylori]|uniref:hypothetical protein n=1 Tax=Helicobacter pylori TaxID=210 RepID=UPI000EAFB135|nr:hypothetical protein [Helicobacter pylori]
METLENLLNEAKRINEKRLKTLFIFLTLNMICLGLHFITFYKPFLSSCFLVVGCYLIWEHERMRKDFQKTKSLNYEKDFSKLDLIQEQNKKLKMFFNVESVVFIFFLFSYLLGAMRILARLLIKCME